MARRASGVIGAAALAAALLVALTLSAAGGAAGASAPAPSAHAAKKKKRCKSKRYRRHHPRRCRKSAAGGGESGGGSVADDCSPASAPGRLAVFEGTPSEYKIKLSRNPVKCGNVIVEQQNLGEDGHDLHLEKNGGPGSAFFGELSPGGVAQQNLYLSKGSWTLYCGLEGHRALGMERTLTVD